MIEIKPLDSLTTPRDCALKLLEEASEACEAIKEYDKVQVWVTYQDALFKLANVVQCVCNCLQVLNSSESEWEDAVKTVRRRNIERGRHEIDHMKALTMDWGAHDQRRRAARSCGKAACA